jgi:hypothetical protein
MHITRESRLYFLRLTSNWTQDILSFERGSVCIHFTYSAFAILNLRIMPKGRIFLIVSFLRIPFYLQAVQIL